MIKTANHRFLNFLVSLNLVSLATMISGWVAEIIYDAPRSIFLNQIYFLIPILFANIPCVLLLRKSVPRILTNATAIIIFQVLLMILCIPLFWIFILRINYVKWPLSGLGIYFVLFHELLTRKNSFYQKQHWYPFALLFAQIAIVIIYYLGVYRYKF